MALASKIANKIFPLILASFWSSIFLALAFNISYLLTMHRRIFVWRSFLAWLIIFPSIVFLKYLASLFFKKFNYPSFWQTTFVKALDKIFLIVSLPILTIYTKNDQINLVIIFFSQAVLWFYLYFLFKQHANKQNWQSAIKKIALFELLFFILVASLQYYAQTLYIYDFRSIASGSGFTILARTIPIVLFFSASLALILFLRARQLYSKIFLIIWFILLSAWQLFWLLNIAILHFSGLLFSPLALAHAEGSAGLLNNTFLIGLAVGFLIISSLLFYSLYKYFFKPKHSHANSWLFLSGLLLFFFLINLVNIKIFTGSPEFLVIDSFFQNTNNTADNKYLDKNLIKKLASYGIKIDQANNFPAYRRTVYSEQICQDPKLKTKKPLNVIIIFFESFSARLTSVYNPKLKGLTPGLTTMAKDYNTTVFKNVYNSATPTTLGIIAELCSTIPATSKEEKTEVNAKAPCLPKLLKQYGGYQSATYITSVDKEYGQKSDILLKTGIDKIIGKAELAKLIPEKPLSWGYSDHQIFALLPKLIKENKQPFLLTYSTVDTHPPFTTAKDMVKFGDGKNNLLNSFHTADDAFAKFWTDFKKSPLAENTIVVAIADHAIFPATYLTSDGQNIKNVNDGKSTLYDEILMMIYNPAVKYPKETDIFASSLDLAPTLLQMLKINPPNFFEGHSIFDDRKCYPNLIGMNETEIYINQINNKERLRYFGPPAGINENELNLNNNLNLVELKKYYLWKKEISK